MTEISTDVFNTDSCIKNISKICNQNLKEFPYWKTIQDVFMNIKTDELKDIQKYIVKALIRSKIFNKFKYDGYFQIIVDGSGLSSHNYNLNGNCIKKKYKDDKIVYYKYILECKLVVGNIVISLDSEWIENAESLTENQKQDYETKAFERMSKRIKTNYPKQKFILTADALYCKSPMIKICKLNNWKYIFNLNDRLRTIFKDFNVYIECFNECTIANYFLDNNYKYKGHRFNIIKFTETKKNKTTNFHYITNLTVKDDNIKNIVCLGRNR